MSQIFNRLHDLHERIVRLRATQERQENNLNQLSHTVEQQQQQIQQLQESQTNLQVQIALQDEILQILQEKMLDATPSSPSAAQQPLAGTSSSIIPYPGGAKSLTSIRKSKFLDSLGTIVKQHTESAFLKLQASANTVVWQIIVSYRNASVPVTTGKSWSDLPHNLQQLAIAELESIVHLNIKGSEDHWMAVYLLNEQCTEVKWFQEPDEPIEPIDSFVLAILEAETATTETLSTPSGSVQDSSTSQQKSSRPKTATSSGLSPETSLPTEISSTEPTSSQNTVGNNILQKPTTEEETSTSSVVSSPMPTDGPSTEKKALKRKLEEEEEEDPTGSHDEKRPCKYDF